jgi:hypothetical protein
MVVVVQQPVSQTLPVVPTGMIVVVQQPGVTSAIQP